jgi:hypothetical protein
LGGFYETSCDIVQKINNYLWLCEKSNWKKVILLFYVNVYI